MRIFALFIFMLIATATKAQVMPDSSLVKFIKARRYIHLTDTLHLPQSVKPFYANISSALKEQELIPADCYIPAGGTRDEQYFITVRLDHILSVKARAVYAEKEAVQLKVSLINGRSVFINNLKPLAADPSGLDLELNINKLSGKVVSKIIE